MSKHKRRNKREATSIAEMVVNAIDQGLLRSAATAGQQMMEHVIKTDPEVKALVEAFVKQRVNRVLRNGRQKEGMIKDASCHDIFFPLVRQLRIRIGRRDMRLVRARLPAKRYRGIAGV